jgi:DnaD/phage-associated family protein
MRYGKITLNSNVIEITNWERYQGGFDKAEYMREYMKEYRKTQRKTNSKTFNGKTSQSEEEEEEEAAAAAKNVFAFYEENIGMLTPIIGDEIKGWLEKVPESWVRQAIREAKLSNAHSWRYIEKILLRYEKQGYADFEREPAGTTVLREEWL